MVTAPDEWKEMSDLTEEQEVLEVYRERFGIELGAAAPEGRPGRLIWVTHIAQGGCK